MLLRKTVYHVHDLQIIIVYVVTTGLYKVMSRKHLTNIHTNTYKEFIKTVMIKIYDYETRI